MQPHHNNSELQREDASYIAKILGLACLLLLLPLRTWEAEIWKCPMNDPIPIPHAFYQPGKLLIGGLVSQISYHFHQLTFTELPSRSLFEVPNVVTKFYQHGLALLFAVNEINENSQILPNVTLGFHIYDSYFDARMTYRTTLDLLFKSQRFVPNYKCDTQKYLIAIIGRLGAEVSFRMADILSLYKIPQLTYGSFAPAESEQVRFPFFYRMVPNETLQYLGIISLLKYFGWTWIGLFAVDNESGEHFLHSLDQLFSKNGICSSFVEKIPNQHNAYNLDGVNIVVSNIYQALTESKANVFAIYGEPLTILWLNTYVFLGFPGYKEDTSLGKVWIMTAQLDFTLTGLQNGWDFQLFQGAFSFTSHSNVIERFQKFVQTIKPSWNQGDGFLKDFWEQAFNCMFAGPQNTIRDNDTCTGYEELRNLPGTLFEIDMTGHSYSIYNALCAIAHALHDINQLRSKFKAMAGGKMLELQDLQPWKLVLENVTKHIQAFSIGKKFNPFLQEISFNNSVGETVSFNNQREIEGSGFDIMNMITFPNTSFQRVKVGRVDQDVLEGKEIIINEDIIVWPTNFKQVTPVSACNNDCFPSYQKKKKEGGKFCCFECVFCPDGKISTQKNMDDCFQCPEDQYPNQNRNKCISKIISFLSYEEPLGIGLASVAGSFSLLTAFVLGIYMRHKDTPIVKANNQKLSFVLLASLFLCFLSSFLFLGHPGKETCLLRQSAFVIIFSVAVSSVLAKTITVIIAFVANKPGSGIRKWMGKNLPISIPFSCSFVQAGICVVWMVTSPPYPYLDMESLPKEIIANCNEGSIIMFYLALGYMGLLSIISFIVAFLARKLPDTFNEAKFITFSMLMFCSVWLSFVPTYLSTKGKYVVAVEIFSILASSAGLLGCIFFPKGYIILLKPELNVREHLIRRKRT